MSCRIRWAQETCWLALSTPAAGQEALRTGLARARVDSVGRWRKALDDRENRDGEREIGPLF